MVSVPVFSPDSAMAYVASQIAFGPRVPNTPASASCALWLEQTLRRFTTQVTVQSFKARAFDGTILNGRNFTTAGTFTNQGTLNVGAGSTFTVGGGGTYQQSGGSTLVNGRLVASQLSITGGTIGGSGEIQANVLLSGTEPGQLPRPHHRHRADAVGPPR